MIPRPPPPSPGQSGGWRSTPPACGARAVFRWALASLGLGVIGCLLAFPSARAAGSSQEFENANRLYEQGRFADAASSYADILKQGRTSPAVYFNLGNACFKSGQVGRALLNYRLAERAAPRDPDVRANLRFARNSVPGATSPAEPAWRRWMPRLSLNEWVILAAGLLWLVCAQIAAGQFLAAIRAANRRWVPATLVALCLALAGFLIAASDQLWTTHAVVIQRDTIMRYGPLEESPSLEVLPDGRELRVIDRKDDWLQVSGAARGTGWVRRDQVELLPR